MLRAAILVVILVSQAHSACETILATDSSKVAKTGDTMTGPLVFSGASSYVTAVSSINAQGIWGTFTGNLTGNVTGNCSTATGITGGAVAEIPYQTGSGATAFLPAMGSGGMVTGNGAGVHPSTATLQGTASQVTVTKTATAVTLSLPATINVNTSGNAGTATALAANGANCSAGQYARGVDASGAAEDCTAAGGASTDGDNVWTSSNTFRGTMFGPQIASAWVVFTGTGTVQIQRSFNITSVTDNATGDYTVTFDRDFDSHFYACTCLPETSNSTSVDLCNVDPGTMLPGSIRINTYNSTDGTNARDPNRVMMVCFGYQ